MYNEGGFYYISKFKCDLCGNEDLKYVGYKNNKPYCRKCISFKGESADLNISFIKKQSKAFLKYGLSEDQDRISKQLLENYKNHLNTLVYAVCGAGKTELVFRVIEYALSNKFKVGFAVPRKDVVIELAVRFKNTFKNNLITSLYGGNTSHLYGDIICLTTHQLYRYNNYFDLLILDEIDAFPYKGNDVLNALFKRSVKGNFILMSATPDDSTLKEFSKGNNRIEKLFTRYHKKPIPVPKIKISFSFLKYIFLINKLKKYIENDKQCFIFTPTIDESKVVFDIISKFVKKGNYVNSKRDNRAKIIQDFRDKKYMYLVTTAVLERGVTVKNLQVIIFNADSEIYNKYALLQISGRVGRVIGYEKGEVYYLCSKKTKAMEDAIEFTKKANSNL